MYTADGAHAALEIRTASKLFEHTRIMRSQSYPKLNTAGGAHAAIRNLDGFKALSSRAPESPFIQLRIYALLSGGC